MIFAASEYVNYDIVFIRPIPLRIQEKYNNQRPNLNSSNFLKAIKSISKYFNKMSMFNIQRLCQCLSCGKEFYEEFDSNGNTVHFCDLCDTRIFCKYCNVDLSGERDDDRYSFDACDECFERHESIRLMACVSCGEPIQIMNDENGNVINTCNVCCSLEHPYDVHNDQPGVNGDINQEQNNEPNVNNNFIGPNDNHHDYNPDDNNVGYMDDDEDDDDDDPDDNDMGYLSDDHDDTDIDSGYGNDTDEEIDDSENDSEDEEVLVIDDNEIENVPLAEHVENLLRRFENNI